MCVRVVTLAFALAALCMGGCSRVGLCTKDVLSSDESPDGRYSVEVVSSKCFGATKAREVVMHKLTGAWHDSRPVAIFDDSDEDMEVRVNAAWDGDTQVVVHGHGAKLWSFQPGWHDVRIIEK